MRDAVEQRRGQPGDRQLRDQEPEPEPLVEHRRLGLEADEPRLLGQGRVQLRRVEEPRRAVVHRRQFVGVGESDRVRSEQSATGELASTHPASACSCRRSYSHQYFNFGSDDRSRRSTTRIRNYHRTSTARAHELRLLGRRERRHGERQRPDLHPAQHVGDELQAAHGERQDVLGGRSGRRVRAVHPERPLPQLAPRPVRRARRVSSIRWSTAST